MYYSKIIAFLAALLTLSACGGGGVSVTQLPNPADTSTPEVQALNGIWDGDYTDNSGKICSDVKALTYNGSVYAISEGCNVIFAGTLNVDGSNVTISFDLFDTEGVSTGGAALSGSFTPQSQINGSLNDGSSLNLIYNTVYEADSSLALINNGWGLSETTATATYLYLFDINGAGELTSLNTASGCSYTGTFSIIDPDYNLYAMNLTVSGCTDNFESRNGNYGGIASLSTNTQELTVLVANDQNAFFAEFLSLTGKQN